MPIAAKNFCHPAEIREQKWLRGLAVVNYFNNTNVQIYIE